MRNKNVDLIRTIALCLVIIYHIWVLAGPRDSGVGVINTFVMLGGELGVTMFFLLSGYGIYMSLNSKSDKVSFVPFIKRRFLRIAPEYYISIVLVICITSGGAAFISKEGLDDIFTHLLFVHNIFPNSAGAINGALWTMGNTVQFYIIAIPLYYCIRKRSVITVCFACALTIASKIVLLMLVLPYFNMSHQFFWASREFFISVFDNFVIGMFVAHLISNHNSNLLKLPRIIQYLLLGAFIIVLYIVCKLGLKYGIHTNNWSGYLWHTVIAIVMAMILYTVSLMDYIPNALSKSMLWISKYEYPIYVLHLVMIGNLLSSSPLIQWLNTTSKLSYLVMMAVLFMASIGLGYLYGELVDCFRNKVINK